MFKKLHLQMTFFCTLITSLILVALSFLCLSIAEKGTARNNYISFLNNVNSLVTHLEDQTTISHQWLLQMENSYHVTISIHDNGSPLYYNILNENTALLEVQAQAVEMTEKEYGLDIYAINDSLLSQHTEFSMKGPDNNDYYVSAARFPRGESTLSVLTLYCLDIEQADAWHQRFLFLGVDIVAIILLAVFAWIFTGRLIRPIQENRERQIQFIASASHELRSPLTVILASFSAMKIASKKEAEVFSRTIESEGERMTRLIGDMLSLANADNGSWSIHPEPLELDTLLLMTYEKYEQLAELKGLLLSVVLPDTELTPCSCDEGRMTQVLSILLDNAFSYTPPGGKINLSLAKEGNRYLLRVADNGPGIPAQSKALIFERFYRDDKSHQDKEHFGLGLCIAQEIVKLHKGRLLIEDTPGGGATFVISLPV